MQGFLIIFKWIAFFFFLQIQYLRKSVFTKCNSLNFWPQTWRRSYERLFSIHTISFFKKTQKMLCRVVPWFFCMYLSIQIGKLKDKQKQYSNTEAIFDKSQWWFPQILYILPLDVCQFNFKLHTSFQSHHICTHVYCN